VVNHLEGSVSASVSLLSFSHSDTRIDLFMSFTFALSIIIPPKLHIRLSINQQVYNRSIRGLSSKRHTHEKPHPQKNKKIKKKGRKWIVFCEFGVLVFISVMHKTEVLTSQRTHSMPIRKNTAKEIFDIQGEIILHEKTQTQCVAKCRVS